MAVQLSVKTESLLSVTSVAAVDLTEFTLTEVRESKPTRAKTTTNWEGGAFYTLKGMAFRRI